MRVLVGDVRLFVDVLGPRLVADGWDWRPRPTLLLIHGGPGFDHLAFRQPGLPFERLAEVARVVLVDLRGCGASDLAGPDSWNLATWADDLAALCDLLGIERPVVLGESGGGFVALELGRRHPGLASGLVLANTSAQWSLDRVGAAFARRGGEHAGTTARKFWANPLDAAAAAAYAAECMPLYAPPSGLPAEGGRKPPPHLAPPDPAGAEPRRRYHHELLGHFAINEMRSFDHLPTVAALDVPLLLFGGVHDPVCPIEDSDDIAAAARADGVTYHRVAHAGHTVAAADPTLVLTATEAFLRSLAA